MYSRSSVTADIVHDVAARNNVKIKNKEEEEGYLLVLQSADYLAQLVDDLPDYVEPRLVPVPTVVSPRPFSKRAVAENDQNAWSYVTNLQASAPTSDILKGKTCVIKDNMSVGGLPYTCGTFPELASPKDGKYRISEIDSTVVQRLLLAGAVIVGTSTCENYSLTPLSYTSANGPVHNPWLHGYNAGGSSSGSAFLLSLRQARAAGVPGLQQAGPDTDIAMGGDQAGSIRLPASFCGIYGLKPTHGLVPYTGIAGLHPMIDHAGPMATNVEDIATMLTVLAGYDGLDPRMTPETPHLPNVPQYHTDLAAFTASAPPSTLGTGLKVGIISESLTSPGTSPEVAAIVRDAAIKHFTAAGAIVSEVSVPLHLLGPAIWTASTRTHMATLTAGTRVPDLLTYALPHYTPRWPLDQEMYDLLTAVNPAVINITLSETFLTSKYSSATQAKAHRHVFQLRAAYDKALEEFDVLITPTTPTVAPPMPKLGEGGSVQEKMRLAMGTTNNTCPFNATGHPGLNVPCGWGKATVKEDVGAGGGWLPVGMQIIGKKWAERTVLKAAKVFEVGGGGLGQWPGRF